MVLATVAGRQSPPKTQSARWPRSPKIAKERVAMLKRHGRRIFQVCSLGSASRPRVSAARCTVFSQSVVPPPLGRTCPRSTSAMAADRAALAPVPRAGASAARSPSQCPCASRTHARLVRLEQCCLTGRSSGLAPA